MADVPSLVPYVVVGAGIHGLSTAYHLAKELASRGLGSGADILVLDKHEPGAGASGIACGVVRNNYFQPAMSELMQACVEVWESDPAAYATTRSATWRSAPRCRSRTSIGDLRAPGADRLPLDARHRARARSTRYMKELFPDWRAQGRDGVPARAPGRLRVQPGLRHGPAGKCAAEGRRAPLRRRGDRLRARRRRRRSPPSRPARARSRSASRSSSRRARGRSSFWRMLGLPPTIDIRTPSGDVVRDRPMWTYWNLQEGEITVDPPMFALADGGDPPVIHLDTDAPLYTDDGKLVTDELWGIYYKRDRHGVQGGASPLVVDGASSSIRTRSTTDVDPDFPDMWCAALSHAMSRFEGCRPLYKQARSGGIGAFTADNFPVFDYIKPNVYAILDSNHGYKMIGVGREVAKVARRRALEPALPVPLRALRDRRPPPGLELALPLELRRPGHVRGVVFAAESFARPIRARSFAGRRQGDAPRGDTCDSSGSPLMSRCSAS